MPFGAPGLGLLVAGFLVAGVSNVTEKTCETYVPHLARRALCGL